MLAGYPCEKDSYFPCCRVRQEGSNGLDHHIRIPLRGPVTEKGLTVCWVDMVLTIRRVSPRKCETSRGCDLQAYLVTRMK
jgi:hypothetical protein